MAFGISGDNPGVGNQPSVTMLLIEMRAMNNLLQSALSPNAGGDQLGRLRNDQAFELNLSTPLPGAGR